MNRKLLLPLLIGALALLLSACSVDIARNSDGSLTAAATMGLADLESELEGAFSYHNTQVRNVDVSAQGGALAVTMERERAAQPGTFDTLSYLMTPGIEDGGLVITLSDVLVNGQPADPEKVSEWQERITERLAGRRENRPNATLQSVSVTEDGLEMVYRIEARRSQGG